MKATISRLGELLTSTVEYITGAPEPEMADKPHTGKWSKKEILGHLIDSAINNTQRFTEIQFKAKPYKIRPYDQNALVRANDYQNAPIKKLVELWVSFNNRIKSLMDHQTDETLTYKIELDDGNISDLKFLMTDYVDHLEHHVLQITGKTAN